MVEKIWYALGTSKCRRSEESKQKSWNRIKRKLKICKGQRKDTEKNVNNFHYFLKNQEKKFSKKLLEDKAAIKKWKKEDKSLRKHAEEPELYFEK